MGRASDNLDAPDQVLETASGPSIHITGEDVQVFRVGRKHRFGVQKPWVIPRFMAVSANDGGKILQIYLPVKRGQLD